MLFEIIKQSFRNYIKSKKWQNSYSLCNLQYEDITDNFQLGFVYFYLFKDYLYYLKDEIKQTNPDILIKYESFCEYTITWDIKNIKHICLNSYEPEYIVYSQSILSEWEDKFDEFILSKVYELMYDISLLEKILTKQEFFYLISTLLPDLTNHELLELEIKSRA